MLIPLCTFDDGKHRIELAVHAPDRYRVQISIANNLGCFYTDHATYELARRDFIAEIEKIDPHISFRSHPR